MTFEKDETILELQCLEAVCKLEYENAVELRDKRLSSINYFYDISKYADDGLFIKSARKLIKYLFDRRFENENQKCIEGILEFEKAKDMLKKAECKKGDHKIYAKNISKKMSDIQQIYNSVIYRRIVED